MKKLFAILLILLLPLRGWTADCMATGPAEQPPSAQELRLGGMSPDCPMAMAHADASVTHQDSTDTPDKASHHSCNFCQLCMPLAALDSPALQWLMQIPATTPSLDAVAFASTAPQRHIKPPIL